MSCVFCNILINEQDIILYQDNLCAIFPDKYKSKLSILYCQCVPLRHIRDINHLRPNNSNDKERQNTNKLKTIKDI